MTRAEHYDAAIRRLAIADRYGRPEEPGTIAAYLSAIGHALLAQIDPDTIPDPLADTATTTPAGGRPRHITDPDSIETPGGA